MHPPWLSLWLELEWCLDEDDDDDPDPDVLCSPWPPPPRWSVADIAEVEEEEWDVGLGRPRMIGSDPLFSFLFLFLFFALCFTSLYRTMDRWNKRTTDIFAVFRLVIQRRMRPEATDGRRPRPRPSRSVIPTRESEGRERKKAREEHQRN